MKNRNSLHSIWGFILRTGGSLSFGQVDHFRKRQPGSFSFGISNYPLSKSLNVDIPYLMSLIKKLNPRIVLLMNYFGYTPTKEAVKTIKSFKKDIIVLEDFTHCLFSLPEEWNDDIDCYVASIRKSIGVPDGGIVISKRKLNSTHLLKNRTLFLELHIKAGVCKKWYTYSAKSDEKRLYRSMQAEARDIIKTDYDFYEISKESREIISNTDIETVRYARKVNYAHLYDLVKQNSNFDVVFPPGDNPAPFMFVIKSKQRNSLQIELAKKGVYCQVIWPLSARAKEICPISKEMEEMMLAIPIDQRYGFDDIEEIGQRINSIEL